MSELEDKVKKVLSLDSRSKAFLSVSRNFGDSPPYAQHRLTEFGDVFLALEELEIIVPEMARAYAELTGDNSAVELFSTKLWKLRWMIAAHLDEKTS